MSRKKIIIGGLVVLGILIISGILLFTKLIHQDRADGVPRNQVVSTEAPVDIAMDFYNPWLQARQSTTTTPYAEGLATKEILSENLRTRLIQSEGRGESEIDPVLCQTTVPERVTGRVVSEQEHETRVLIMARDKTLTAQSVFTLKKHNDGWFIEDIECFAGEFAPEREFTFEKEGFLLKSVPPPYNPENWHLIFEDNGELGHVVPLFLTASSSCTTTDGSVMTCSFDQFGEAKKARVFGNMTEMGVDIARLEFLE